MDPTCIIWTLVIAAAWVAFAALCRGLLNNPGGDIPMGFLYWSARLYVRLVHHVRFEGLENVPPAHAGRRLGNGPGSKGPLVLIANHTAGIDPMLLQPPCQFHIRWMMGRDMFIPQLNWLWEWQRAIPVTRAWVEGDAGSPDNTGTKRADGQSALEAIRHLRAGNVLGVFPEGRIGPAEGAMLPFLPGIGVIVKKTGAAVLPAIITGTPRGGSAYGSLFRPSHSRVRFLPVVEYAGTTLDAGAIVEDLRCRMLAHLAPSG